MNRTEFYNIPHSSMRSRTQVRSDWNSIVCAAISDHNNMPNKTWNRIVLALGS